MFLRSGRVLLYSLALVGYCLLTGCQRSDGARVTVLGEDFSNTHAMEDLKDEYESTSKVKLNFVKNTFDIFSQKAYEDLSQGTGQYDIVLHYSSALPTFAGRRQVFTVEEIKKLYPEGDYTFEKEIFPEVWRDSSYYKIDGADKPAGYPFAANTMILVYNKELFDAPVNRESYRNRFGEDLVVPTDWPQFMRVAEFFTQPEQGTYGVVLQGASGSPLYWEWCNFAFGMGGGVMRKRYGWEGDENTPLVLASPETVAATRFYLALKPFNIGDFFSTGQAEQQERMRTQQVAMAIMWSDSLYPLVNDDLGNRFGFAPIPGGKSMIGGGTYFLSKGSRHPEAAAKYIVDSMQPENQIELMKRGLCSSVDSAYSDPEVQKIPYIPAVRASLKRGVYMLESGPDAQLIRDVIERTVQELWRAGSDADVGKALMEAQAEIERLRPQAFGQETN